MCTGFSWAIFFCVSSVGRAVKMSPGHILPSFRAWAPHRPGVYARGVVRQIHPLPRSMQPWGWAALGGEARRLWGTCPTCHLLLCAWGQASPSSTHCPGFDFSPHFLLLGHFYFFLLSLTMYLKHVKLNPEFLCVSNGGGRRVYYLTLHISRGIPVFFFGKKYSISRSLTIYR